MSYAMINLYFNIALFLGFGLGILIMLWWGWRIYKPVVKQLEGMAARGIHVGRHTVAMLVFWKMLPAIFMMIVCVVPLFYFHNLLKRFDYCQEIVRVNKINTTTDTDLIERCKGLDLQEVLESARK